MPDVLSSLLMIYTALVIALLCFAAWRDIVSRTVPDTVSILLILIGAGTRLAQGWQPFGLSLLVAATVFVLLLPLCSRGLLGGADLKLIAALSAGLSPLASLHLVADVTLVGGILALLYVLLNKVLAKFGPVIGPTNRTSSLLYRILNIEFWRIRRRSPLPYAIAILVGATVAVLNHQGV